MEQQEFNLARQLRYLWRFKWIIILVAVVVGGTSLVFSATNPPLQEATTTILVGQTQQRLAAVPSELQGILEMTYLQDIGSQIEVMKSRSVLEQAIITLEPEKATDPDYLQAEVLRLQSSLDIQQVGTTDLVTLTVGSADPLLAQKQANAVAEAYINEVRKATTASIQNDLEDITQRLEELQENNINLSINPVVPKLTSQIDATLSALDATSGRLEQIVGESTEPVLVDTGTVLTASQLSIVSGRMSELTSEANAINELLQTLKPVSSGGSPSQRSADIAVIEGHILGLNTKLDSLITYVTNLYQAETDPLARQRLITTGELLNVAAASGGIVLTQVVSLYDIQVQYLTSNLFSENATTGGEQYREADVNAMQRIVQHHSMLIDSLNAAMTEIEQTIPRSSTIMQWRVNELNDRIAVVISILQEISTQLKPTSTTSEADILLTHEELLDIEIRARAAEISLGSFLSEIDELQSNAIDVQTSTVLLGALESLNVANDAFSGLGDAIAAISQSGGDMASYNALDALRQQLQLTLLSSDFSGTRIVDTAVVSPAASFFGRYRGVLLAIIAGLLLTVMGILIFRYFDRTARDESQVKSQIDLPLLTSIPAVRKNLPDSTLSVLDKSLPRYLESFRLLRTNLGLDATHGKIILVTSPEEHEGKTTVAANLALVVALQGRKTLLIDGNLHHPGIANLFGLTEVKSLSEVMNEDKDKGKMTNAQGVDIIAGGAVSVQSAELFSSPRFKTLLAKYRQDYDVIIVDSAPVIGSADTKILARDADSVLLVLRPDTSKIDLAIESKQTLESVNAHVAGFILNGVVKRNAQSSLGVEQTPAS
jgi:capsular exopolysaccharide synthesis family protein